MDFEGYTPVPGDKWNLMEAGSITSVNTAPQLFDSVKFEGATLLPSQYALTIINLPDGRQALQLEILGATATPTAPIASLTQPTCTTPTGTITITSPTGTGMTYSMDGTTYPNTTGIFSNVAPGTYSLTAKNASNAISPPTTVTINAVPLPGGLDTTTATQLVICEGDTTNLETTCTTGIAEWSLTSDFFTLIIDFTVEPTTTTTYYTRCNNLGCFSAIDSVTITVNPKPAKPIITTIQPDCTHLPGALQIDNYTGFETYALNPPNAYYQQLNVLTSLQPGNHVLTSISADGCISDTVQAVLVTFNGDCKDTLILSAACDTCSVVACQTNNSNAYGGNVTTYASCGNSTDYTASLPDAVGCVTFTPTSAQDSVADTSCVITCLDGFCDTTIVIIKPLLSIHGNVFNDSNGLSDSLVNGVGIANTSGNPIIVTLQNVAGSFTYQTVNVDINGNYSFNNLQADSGYQIVLCNVCIYPYYQSGYHIGVDKVTDAVVYANVYGAPGFAYYPIIIPQLVENVYNANFGINVGPVVTDSLMWAANPYDSNFFVIPPALFNSNDNYDNSGGSVASIFIGTYPDNVESFKIGDSIYTSTTFPIGGVSIPTLPNGDPAVPICVNPENPFDTTLKVDILFIAFDSAGASSEVFGTNTKVTIEFYDLVNIEGIVYNDLDSSANGTNSNIQNGTEVGTNGGAIFFAYAIDSTTGKIIDIDTIDASGNFALQIDPNTTVTVLLSTTASMIGNAAPAITLPANWVATSAMDTTFAVEWSNPIGPQNVPTLFLADFGIKYVGAPLNIELISFDVLKTELSNLAKWMVTNTTEIESFELHRSYTSSDKFKNIYTTNSQQTDYLFNDFEISNGVTYYKLLIKELSGNISYSPIIAVWRDDSKVITIYPNPAKETIKITYNFNVNAVYKLNIYDMQGKLVLSKNITKSNGQETISIRELAAGEYLLNIENNTKVSSLKFTKE